MENFLKPTPAIDSDNPLIIEKAKSLVEKHEKESKKAIKLFYFVRDEIKYNAYIPYHLFDYHIASKTLKRGEGYCVSKAILLAALSRAIRIPARLRFADIRNYLLPEKYKKLIGGNILVYHGYTELYIEGKWIKLTPAFDLELCKKYNIKPVEFDGENDAVLHRYTLDGKLHIEYLRDHGYFSDLPFEEMLKARIQVYGPDYIERREKFYKSINIKNDGNAKKMEMAWRETT